MISDYLGIYWEAGIMSLLVIVVTLMACPYLIYNTIKNAKTKEQIEDVMSIIKSTPAFIIIVFLGYFFINLMLKEELSSYKYLIEYIRYIWSTIMIIFYTSMYSYIKLKWKK